MPEKILETAPQALAALQVELMRIKKHVKNYEGLVARITRAIVNQDDSRSPTVTPRMVKTHLSDVERFSEEVMAAAASLGQTLDSLGVPK